VLGIELITRGLGPFDSLTFLGRGGYGETYKAQRDGDTFALKVIHTPNLPEHFWQREITALKTADHRNVVAFRRSGSFVVDGQSYLFLECEFLDGGTGGSRLVAGIRPKSPADLRGFAVGLLQGVSEIHDLGILHRDIKPDNVGFRDSGWANPVLLDFGLARVLEMSSHTEYPAQIGTPIYMSPEQLRKMPARRRSDLFAVGAVLYHVGTGAHPFLRTGISTFEQLLERMAAMPLDPSTLSSVFDGPISSLVVRMLSFRAHERLSVAKALSVLEGG